MIVQFIEMVGLAFKISVNDVLPIELNTFIHISIFLYNKTKSSRSSSTMLLLNQEGKRNKQSGENKEKKSEGKNCS